jgi:hypothetical protein
MKERRRLSTSKVNGYSMKAKTFWFGDFPAAAAGANAQTADEVE